MSARMIRYNLSDFEKIKDEGIYFELDEVTIMMINSLAKRVGAPSYQKTPVFRKKPKPKKVITEDDWEEMRNFKKTELNRNEDGIELEIDRIRICLNQITEDNYDEMKENISNILLGIMKSKFEEDDLYKVGKSIFEVGSLNKFWSKLYAKLYKDLASEFVLMKGICEKNFMEFMGLFENIRFVSSEENYDLFCDINKENAKRCSLSAFFVHLMNENLIEPSKIKKLLSDLKDMFVDKINEEGNNDVVNEIVENMVIIIQGGQRKFENELEDFWESMVEFVEKMSECDRSEYKSYPSKCVFKFLDLVDEL